MAKKKYSIDLAGLMAECEANYMRIMKLLPEMSTVDIREFAVELAGGAPIQFRMEIKERCKYTTMIDISQQPLKIPACPSAVRKVIDEQPQEASISAKTIQGWLTSPKFSLRI